MPKMSLVEQAFVQFVQSTPTTTTLAPGPGTNPTDAKAAVRRCCAAWQRAYKAYMQGRDETDSTWIFLASKPASVAYCNAMPLLVGEDGIRDFIACAAHGIVIGAIQQDRSSQLLYAAQVALSLLQHQTRQPRLPLAPPSKPAPRELPPPPPPENRPEISA